MDNKLTLKLDRVVIERAKRYASRKKLSLSRLVETYRDTLTKKDQEEELEISPFVKSITTGKSIPANIDDRKARKKYIDFLDKKYR